MAFLIAAGIGLVLVPLVRRLGLVAGLVDRPGPLKIHRASVPVTGGLAVTGATLGAVAITGGWMPPMIVAAVALAFVVGLVDDLRPLPAWLRINLIAAAGVLVAIELPLGPLGVFGTVLVVLACANGVNILDGQDGLAGGVSVAAALSLGVVLVSSGAVGSSLALALGGALVAFVVWNRPPARVFLGNGGAYAVGTVLGILAASSSSTLGWRGILAAGVCLGVLAFEVTSTVWRRLMSGDALGTGDRGHSYDVLAERLGRGRTLLVFWGLGAVAGALGIAVGLAPALWWSAPAAAAVVLGAVSVWTFGRTVRRARQETYVGEPVSSETKEATITGIDMRDVLVTGGAGFIGSHLVRSLAASGARVRVLDDLSTGSKQNLRDLNGSVELIAGDVRDPDAVRRAVEGTEAVFHLAALPTVARSVADPATSNAVNVDGTVNVLVAARDAGVRRVVYASSSSVYGNTPTLPKHEAMAVRPLSPYAASKLAGEVYCRGFAGVYGLETVSLRFFNVFGPRQDPESEYAAVIPRFASRLLAGERPVVFGDGGQSRDFTFVTNAVQACLLAAEAGPDASGEAMNIGCGERITLLDLIETMNHVLGTDIDPEFADPRPGDVRHSEAAIEEAGRLIGYRPLVSLREGLERTIDWLAERRSVVGAR